MYSKTISFLQGRWIKAKAEVQEVETIQKCVEQAEQTKVQAKRRDMELCLQRMNAIMVGKRNKHRYFLVS